MRGSARELPDAGGADVRSCIGVVGRLNVRQSRKFDRNAQRAEFGLDENTPATRSLETLPESVRETLLITNAAHGSLECRVIDIRRP